MRSSQPARTSSTIAMRRCDVGPGPCGELAEPLGRAAVSALRVIQGTSPGERIRPPAVRRACRYRQATDRVPAGSRVRYPACPRCGQRLGYRATATGALFLHVDDAAFRLTCVKEVP